MMLERNLHVRNSMKIYHNQKLSKMDKKEASKVEEKSQLESTSSQNKSMIVIKSFRPGSG